MILVSHYLKGYQVDILLKLTDIDYADDLVITANTISNSTTLLHQLENAAKDVGLYVNASKTEYKQQGLIQTIAGEQLKAVDSFYIPRK